LGEERSGAAAVERAVAEKALADTTQFAAPDAAQIRHVGDKTFVLQGGAWTDTRFDATRMRPRQVSFASEAYFRLLRERPELGQYLAIGESVIVVVEGTAYQIAPA
jgi:hypothetical protein